MHAPRNDSTPIRKASKNATKYIISGNFENVKSATAQFETILGLEPGSSIILNIANKRKPKGSSLSLTRTSTSTAAGGGDDVNEPAGYDINNDTEAENAKKARRKQKKGKKMGNHGSIQEDSMSTGVKAGQPHISLVGEA